MATFKQYLEEREFFGDANTERYQNSLNNATTATDYSQVYTTALSDNDLINSESGQTFIRYAKEFGTSKFKINFATETQKFSNYLDMTGRKRFAAEAIKKMSNEDDIKAVQSSVISASKRQKAVTASTFSQYLDSIGDRLKNPNTLQKLRQVQGKVLEYLNNAAIAVQTKKQDGTLGEITYRLKGLSPEQRAQLSSDQKPYYNKARRIMRLIRNQLSFNKLKVQSYSNDYIEKRQAISAAARKGSPSQFIRKNQRYQSKYKTTDPTEVKRLAKLALEAGMTKSFTAGKTKIDDSVNNTQAFNQENLNTYKQALKSFSDTFKTNKYTAAEIKQMFDSIQS